MTSKEIIEKIDAAVGNFVVESFQATREGREVLPIIKDVGVPDIDKALPFLNGDAGKARNDFLSVYKYLLRERQDAPEARKLRKKSAEAAASHIRKAAELLAEIENPEMASLLYSMSDWTDMTQYGHVIPKKNFEGNTTIPGTQNKRDGIHMEAHFVPDALTGNFNAARGGLSRDANIVKAIAQFFPDSQEFLSASNGYSIIAGLAVLCGLENKNPKQYVRETLLRANNKGDTKAEEPQPRRDTSIAALLTWNKPT